MTLITPPAGVNFGFVTGRFALAVADTALDEDHLPNFIPAAGTISFRPVAAKIVTTAPARYISPQTVTATLNSAGLISDGNGLTGIWLVVGVYTVSFKLAGLTVQAFDVEVTGAHTEAAPLDLVLHTPAPIEPSVKFVVNEQVYTETLAARDETLVARDEAVAAAAGGGGGAGIDDAVTAADSTWSSAKIDTSLGGKAASVHTHTTAQVTGLDTALAGKAATSHTHATSQVTGLDTALAGKAASAHTHAQSDVTGLTTALAAKLASSNGTVTDVQYVQTLPATVVNGTLYLTPKA